MQAFGFSLNNLSLFGLVLAIGIVVDDAIVVVENVERNIALGLAPVEATKKAMNEVSGAVSPLLWCCARCLSNRLCQRHHGAVLPAVRIDHRRLDCHQRVQFADPFAALSAILLKGHHAKKDWFAAAWIAVLGWFFRLFNKGFERSTNGYTRAVGGTLRRAGIALAVYVGLLALTWGGFKIVPTGFIPTQDSGYLIVFAQLPDGASLERTHKIISRAGEIARTIPGVNGTVEFPGFNLFVGGNLPNAGTMFVSLEEFRAPQRSSKSAQAIMGQLHARYDELRDALVLVLPPPPVRGFGNTAGFKMMIQDRAASVSMRSRARPSDDGKRQPDARARAGVHHVHHPRAAASRRGGPREGQEYGRGVERRERRVANLSRLALRE